MLSNNHFPDDRVCWNSDDFDLNRIESIKWSDIYMIIPSLMPWNTKDFAPSIWHKMYVNSLRTVQSAYSRASQLSNYSTSILASTIFLSILTKAHQHFTPILVPHLLVVTSLSMLLLASSWHRRADKLPFQDQLWSLPSAGHKTHLDNVKTTTKNGSYRWSWKRRTAFSLCSSTLISAWYHFQYN